MKKFADNLYLSIDCVIFGYNRLEGKLKVLLIEQERIDEVKEPFKALPGDLIFEDEDLPVAANRVLHELTGLEGVFLKQFQVFGNPERVKNEKDRMWLEKNRKNPSARVITVGYYSLVRLEDYIPTPSSFAKKAEWIDIEKVPNLAFDHNEIFDEALLNLKKDTIADNINFKLLPTKFTITQLQTLYEIILGKELDKRNFRKYIKKIDKIVPLDEKEKNVAHKPAILYTLDKSV